MDAEPLRKLTERVQCLAAKLASDVPKLSVGDDAMGICDACYIQMSNERERHQRQHGLGDWQIPWTKAALDNSGDKL